MERLLLFPPGLISAIIAFVLAWKIYTANPKKMQNRLFVVLMMGFFILCFCVFLINLSNEVHYILFIGRIYYLAAIFLPAVFFNFTLVFPKQTIRKKHLFPLFLLYSICFGCYIYFFNHTSIDDVSTVDFGNYVYFNASTFFIGFFLMILLVLAVMHLFIHYKKSNSFIEKQQIKHVFYGGLIAITVVIIHLVLLYLNIKTYFMIPVSISIFSIFIAAAIQKFNLFVYKPMTEIMLTRERMVSLNRDELEKEVEARTAALLRTNEELEQEVAERSKAQEQLTKSLQEKELLLKEIHHRVKNNLQIISSLLYLQNRKIQDDKVKTLLEEINTRIRSMSLVHEHLYKSNNIENIDLHKYVHAIVDELVSLYKINTNNIKVTINIEKVSVDMNTSILLGLLINELVSNALKHGFPHEQKGEISIEILSKYPQFSLVVRDNGIGLPQDIDIKNTKTLGLQLVNALVKQLGGKLDIRVNNWTEFKISSIKEQEHFQRRDTNEKDIDR